MHSRTLYHTHDTDILATIRTAVRSSVLAVVAVLCSRVADLSCPYYDVD